MTEIRSKLGTFEELADLDLHDARVTHLERPKKGTVHVGLDVRDCFAISGVKTILLRFAGVECFEPSVVRGGQVWLHAELSMSSTGQVELRVLLTADELRVVADSVVVLQDP